MRKSSVPAPVSAIPRVILDEAQAAKKAQIAGKLVIKPEIRLLNIG
jgi:cyclopropane fatty-acyl-phospholipid synthase-like methyltransferase